MRVLVILADGFEEIEAFTVVDVLRRAGVFVTTAGLISRIATGMHQIITTADATLSQINKDDYDMLVIPGGVAYKILLNSSAVISFIQDFNKKKKIIGAICAGPVVLAKAGVLDDKIAAVYPGLEKEIPKPREAKVVSSENIVTSRGPGTAMDFALALADKANKGISKKLREQMIAQ